MALTGRLAESYGPAAAFAVGSAAAGLAFVIALTARPSAYRPRSTPAAVPQEESAPAGS